MNVSNITSSQVSIAELLNPDGTLNLTTGFTGSLNLAGFEVRMDECEGIVAAYAKITGTETGENVSAMPPNTWSALGTGLGARPTAIAINGTDIYVGGLFTQAGGSPANRIAKWDGSNWSALGTGLAANTGNVWCNSLAIIGNEMYVGGHFETAGGIAANAIAKWNISSSTWSAVGSGVGLSGGQTLSPSCKGIATVASNGDVYIVGDFSSVDGVSANHVARWDGNSWSGLGAGLGSTGHTLAIINNDVYVGGAFTSVGDQPAKGIAKWDGSSSTWTALGEGLDFQGNGRPRNVTCTAIAISGNYVYVGGNFNRAGTISATSIARWDATNSTWSALGDGLSSAQGTPYCYALATIESKIYATGSFTEAGDQTVNNIAMWDGTSWFALDDGLNLPAQAIAALNNNIYVGGQFGSAGGSTVRYIAKWEAAPTSSPNLIKQTVATDETLFNVRYGRIGQSFQTGAVAKQLTHIDVQTTGPLNGGIMFMDLYQLNPSTGELMLKASSNSGGYGQGLTTRFFKSQPTLEANTTYAFILRTNGWNFFQLKGTNTGGTYANGTAFKATTRSAPNNDPQLVGYEPIEFDLTFNIRLQ